MFHLRSKISFASRRNWKNSASITSKAAIRAPTRATPIFSSAGERLKLKNAKVASFGTTRKFGAKPSQDINLKVLLAAETPVVTLVGKTWDLHVRDDLRISQKANLELIADSIAYMKKRVDEVIFDAEHFFDGFRANPEYAIDCLKAAQEGGADWIVLCETNGGRLPGEIRDALNHVNRVDQDAARHSLPQRRRAGGRQHARRRGDGRDSGAGHHQRFRRTLRQHELDFGDRQLAAQDGQEVRDSGAAEKIARGVAAILRAGEHQSEQAPGLRRRQRLRP